MKINNRASGISIRIAGGVFALFFLTFAQIQTTAHAEGPLVIATWGGLPDNAQMKNYVEPFTAETGIKIVLVPAPGKHVAQTEAQHSSGKIQWDMILAAFGADPHYLKSKGLLAKIPADVKGRIAGHLRDGAVIDVGVEYHIATTMITCNKKLAKACPTNAKEFFDTANFPGPRSMYAWGALSALVLAEQANGISKDKLFPINIDRAFAKLKQLRPSIRVWYRSGDQSQQTLRDGEVVMGALWDGRAFNLIKQGAPVVTTFENAVFEPSWIVVLKNAPHEKAAWRYLEWIMTRDKVLAADMRDTGLATPSPGALKMLPPEIAKQMSVYPENFAKTVQLDTKWFKWYLENRPKIQARWKELVSSK